MTPDSEHELADIVPGIKFEYSTRAATELGERNPQPTRVD